MPKVKTNGVSRFKYTEAGKRKAATAARKAGTKVMNSRKKKKKY
jgi:hypothetical protein